MYTSTIDRCRDTRHDILDSADLKTKAKPNYQNALTKPVDRCPQVTIDRCWQKCISRRLNRPSIDTLLCLHLTGETQDLLGIYRNYNLQHLNSGPTSNIISNLSYIYHLLANLNKLSSQLLDAQKDIENITNQSFLQVTSASIDRQRGPWIDGKKPVELLPYIAAEVDKITSKIYTALDTMEERLDKRCDDIYFPFDNKISGLDNHAEWLQKEVKAIQRQLAAQHQISASIDRTKAKSIDGNSPRSTNKHIIASIDAESIPIGEQLIHKTVSAYAYDNIGWHKVSIDNIQERLQNISNVLGKVDDKWTRNDEATRKFETGLGGGNLQGSLSQRTLGYRSKRSEQNLVATTIKFLPAAPDTCLKSLHPVIDTPKHKGHFTRADHLEVDERKNNRSMRISADDRYQEMPRQMKINIDRCTQAWLEPVDRCPQVTIDRCWQKCISRRLNRPSIDTLLCLHLTGETQYLLGIYRNYNLQHLNSDPASNIISNLSYIYHLLASYYCYFI
ncbi:hypothetical protein IGI04_007112 [Brassica rapa subsp. trilocularis]|uniref:Uncharacterized protein n=1 Tax=Brassica rapa subsp. trilocularis TaxID=1813537 RepID=A0ABQ7NIT1_BRACM|nr:hypothetical protein IGI04_007112 [Brassica rapa subsp. trilocularis]